jgi:hypothetical protein
LNSWKDKVGNPDAFGDVEKKLWNEIEPLLNDLLDELKAAGKIETIYTPVETQNLVRTLKKLDDIGLAHNTLLDIFEQQDPKTFLQETSKFGFDENKLIYMYVACAVTIEVLSTELFKLRLLFHMKDVDFAVSRFSTTISAAAPTSWPKLRPYVDNEFRNSLSHGTYAVINKKVVLFKDAKLLPSSDPEAEMTLDKFMMRIKSQNVLYQCLVDVLDKKMKSGFFKP